MIDSEILEEAEFAKTLLMNSKLDPRQKKSLLKLLSTATLATNGLSTEEKIQKTTESILGLIVSQITFLDAVDTKITNANLEKCNACKAMQHATDIEQKQENEKVIAEWKKANGLSDSDGELQSKLSWMDVVKKIVIQPGMWIFLVVLTISPYGVEIVKSILNFYSTH